MNIAQFLTEYVIISNPAFMRLILHSIMSKYIPKGLIETVGLLFVVFIAVKL